MILAFIAEILGELHALGGWYPKQGYIEQDSVWRCDVTDGVMW